MRYLLPQRLVSLTMCLVMAAVLWGMPAAGWAGDLNRDLLKKGMTLTEVVQTFGQPARMEWVNMKGTPVLFIFYPSDASDAVLMDDQRKALPLGFFTETLAGWGKKFYEQVKVPGS